MSIMVDCHPFFINNVYFSAKIHIICHSAYNVHGFFRIFALNKREDTPSRQKKKEFLCFALDFPYLCEGNTFGV